MSAPHVLVFDLGKVLVDFDYRIAARAISRRARVTPEEVHRLLHETPLLLDYETGRLTNEGFFQRVREATGFSGDLREFSGCFGDIFSPIEPMIQLHAELRAAGVRTFIFSNTNEFAIWHIRANFPFFGNFDGYIYSYEHQAMKPDPALYEVVERFTGSCGDGLIYIDDRAENIETGKARGWHTILHSDPVETRQALSRLVPALAAGTGR